MDTPVSSADGPADPAALAEFFDRISALCAAIGKGEGPVARRLFADSNRLAQIRSGGDIGVRRLLKAEADLAQWAVEVGVSLEVSVGKADSAPVPQRKAVGP